MKKYVWTKKAEERSRKLGLEERKENSEVDMVFLGEWDTTYTAKDWVKKGYIKVLDI
jgi:hypothetical protein